MNCVTEARVARLKHKAHLRKARDRYKKHKGKGLVKAFIWIHEDDRKSLRDYASWLIERREL